MIYNGAHANGIPKKTGVETNMVNSQSFSYNALKNDNAYIGFKYGAANQSTYALTHTQDNPSNAYTQITNWYSTNIASQGSTITDKIVQNAMYCGDRTAYTDSNATTIGGGYGTQTTYYGAWQRVGNTPANYTPSLSCQNLMGGGVATSSDQYIIPMGMITADEVSFAGGKSETTNSSYWLYTNENYWTMSPYAFASSNARGFYIDSAGRLGSPYVYLENIGLRGVIALKSDAKVSSGDGTMANPYIVS